MTHVRVFNKAWFHRLCHKLRITNKLKMLNVCIVNIDTGVHILASENTIRMVIVFLCCCFFIFVNLNLASDLFKNSIII